MEQQLSEKERLVVRFLISDICGRTRFEMAIQDADYIVHAVAMKHVPAAEYNPFERIHTNVLGAENIVQSAIRAGVKKVVALLTDKAASR